MQSLPALASPSSALRQRPPLGTPAPRLLGNRSSRLPGPTQGWRCSLDEGRKGEPGTVPNTCGGAAGGGEDGEAGPRKSPCPGGAWTRQEKRDHMQSCPRTGSGLAGSRGLPQGGEGVRGARRDRDGRGMGALGYRDPQSAIGPRVTLRPRGAP